MSYDNQAIQLLMLVWTYMRNKKGGVNHVL